MSYGYIYSYTLNDCWYPSKTIHNKWNKLSIHVSKEQRVDVLLDETFVGSVTTYFEIRGYGGLILYSESSSLEAFGRSKFKNFHKKGENCTICD